MARNASLAEAKAKLSECIREAKRGEPVMITRHGKPVAALVGAEELGRLDRLRAAGPGAGLAGLAGGWEDSEELATAVERRVLDRGSQRDDWRVAYAYGVNTARLFGELAERIPGLVIERALVDARGRP